MAAALPADSHDPGARLGLAPNPHSQLFPNSLSRNLITGGAGFVGSHLVDRLMEAGEEVICLDNDFTGRKATVAHSIGHPRIELIR